MTAPASPAPDLEAVRQAAARIRPHVHRTPVLSSTTLNRRLGAEVWFKCENFQKVGAFKARGAVNAALTLPEEQARRGLITHSSGNHAAAVAYAGSIRGVPVTVVMPQDAPSIKIDAVRGYGAEIVFSGRHDRDAVCAREQQARGARFIHPFEDPQVIAGQGTACLELFEDVPDLDLVLAPVGGGGLSAGTAIVARSLNAATRVWGAEPEAVDDAHRSMITGVHQPAVENPETVCDGLLTRLGGINFQILRQRSVEVATVSEPQILEAARFVLQRMKIVIEPSCATVLALLWRRSAEVRGLRIGAILSGGNTDLSWLRTDH